MLKSIYRWSFVVAVVVAFSAASVQAKGLKTKNTTAGAHAGKDKVTLEIAGVADPQLAAQFQKALTDSGMQATVKESKKGGRPMRLIAQVDSATDLGPWAKAVATAVRVRPGQPQPALELVIFAQVTQENSAPTTAELAKVKGVDAKNSSIDVKKGEIHVRISGDDHVTGDDIANAVKQAGVTGRFVKVGHTKKA